MCMFKSGDLNKGVLEFCKERECPKLPLTLSDLDGLCVACKHNACFSDMKPVLSELKQKIVQFNVMDSDEEQKIDMLIEEAVKKGEIFMQKTSFYKSGLK